MQQRLLLLLEFDVPIAIFASDGIHQLRRDHFVNSDVVTETAIEREAHVLHVGFTEQRPPSRFCPGPRVELTGRHRFRPGSRHTDVDVGHAKGVVVIEHNHGIDILEHVRQVVARIVRHLPRAIKAALRNLAVRSA